MAVQIPQDTTGAERFRSKLDGLGRAFLTGQNKSGGNLIQPPATPDLSAYNVGGSKGGAVNGGGFGSGAVTAALQSQSQPSPTTGAGGQQMTYGNDYIEQANKLMTQLQQMVTTGFSYNYQSDPNYVAAVQAAKEGAADASRLTREQMNDRGILNSDITTSQLAQIEQKAQSEPLKLVPQLEQNAYGRYMGQVQGLGNLMNTFLQQGQWEIGRADNERWKDAEVTGTYESPEFKKLFDQLVADKQGWGATTDPKERKRLADDATNVRKALAGITGRSVSEIDKLFGANVGLDAARANFTLGGFETQAAKAARINQDNYLSDTKYTHDYNDKVFNETVRHNKATENASGSGGLSPGQMLTQETNRALTQMLSEIQSPDEVLNWINANKNELLQKGINPKTLYDAASSAFKGSGPQGLSEMEIYDKALAAAQKDYDWAGAATQEERQAIIDKYVNTYRSMNTGAGGSVPAKPKTPVDVAYDTLKKWFPDLFKSPGK